MSVSAFRSAAATLPDTQDGHPPADVCDAASACEAPEGTGSIGSPRMTLAEFRRVVEHRFVLQVSRSFKAREDQSLRRVLILVADTHHYDPLTQADLKELVHQTVRPGDRLLLEQPHDNPVQCHDFAAIAANCYGIDSRELSTRTAAAHEAYFRALAREIHFAVKTIWKVEPMPSFDEFRELEFQLTDYVVRYKEVLAEYDGLLSAPELDRLKLLERDRLAKNEALNNAVMLENPARDAHFMTRLRQHAQETLDGVALALLGLRHVDALKGQVFDEMDAIVVYPKRRR